MENQRKLKKIKNIMDKCCLESLSADHYSINLCKIEHDTDNILLFVYNCKHEIIEARLSNYDVMIEIANKIRQKSKIHISQCKAISNYVRDEYKKPCIVKIVNYRRDLLEVKLKIDEKEEIIQGTYVEIIDKIRNR